MHIIYYINNSGAYQGLSLDFPTFHYRYSFLFASHMYYFFRFLFIEKVNQILRNAYVKFEILIDVQSYLHLKVLLIYLWDQLYVCTCSLARMYESGRTKSRHLFIIIYSLLFGGTLYFFSRPFFCVFIFHKHNDNCIIRICRKNASKFSRFIFIIISVWFLLNC